MISRARIPVTAEDMGRTAARVADRRDVGSIAIGEVLSQQLWLVDENAS